MILTINPEYANQRVVHNKTCKTIGEHTPGELLQLAIEARKSNNKILLRCFDGPLPSLADLTAAGVRVEIATIKAATPIPAPTTAAKTSATGAATNSEGAE